MAHAKGNDPPPDSRPAKVSELGRAFAAALLSGDEIAAEIAIREAMDANLTSADIDDEIIAPALWLVGELWSRGEISVADEHLATEISIRVIALQREAQRFATSRAGRRVLLADSASRHQADVICLTATMPGGSDRVLVSMHEVQHERPGAAFVVGGRDVATRLRSRPGVAVCRRVSEVVESVDAMVQRADMN